MAIDDIIRNGTKAVIIPVLAGMIACGGGGSKDDPVIPTPGIDEAGIELLVETVEHNYTQKIDNVVKVTYDGEFDKVVLYGDESEVIGEATFAEYQANNGIIPVLLKEQTGTYSIDAVFMKSNNDIVAETPMKYVTLTNTAPYQVKSSQINFTRGIPGQYKVIEIDKQDGNEDPNIDPDITIRCLDNLPDYLSYDEETRTITYDGDESATDGFYGFNSSDGDLNSYRVDKLFTF